MRPFHFKHQPMIAHYALTAFFVAAALPVSAAAAPAAPASGASQAATAPPPEVGVITLESRDVPIVKKLPGRVKPKRVAQVRARVPGILLKQIFREGADVKEGDVLFEIEPYLFSARVDSAKASVASADAGIDHAKADLARAALQAKRYRELKDTRAISQQEVDNADAAELLAKAGLKSAEAALLSAKAALAAAELDLGYTKVVAPISGRIGRSFVTEGALVGQGDVTPLAEINQLDPVYVDFSIPANELSSFKQRVGSGQEWDKHMRVALKLDNDKPYSHAGKLLLSEIAVDPATASVKVRSEFPNTEWLLWPEMYMWGEFSYHGGEKAFLIPQQAVIRNPDGAAVGIVGDDNKYLVISIQLTETSGPNWVIRGNAALRDGQKLIVDGGQRAAVSLKPGAIVKPVAWSSPATTPPPAAGTTPPQPAAAPPAPAAK
jgi:membrane fusion protein (multidrug efflux system)